MASHNTFTYFGMAKHYILYNAVNKCITRDIGMGNYEKQGKQKAAYPISISLPPMPHQVYKDIGRDEVCQPLWFTVGTTHIKSGLALVLQCSLASQLPL